MASEATVETFSISIDVFMLYHVDLFTKWSTRSIDFKVELALMHFMDLDVVTYFKVA